MTARAVRRVRSIRHWFADRSSWACWKTALLALLLFSAMPAAAQTGVAMSIFSEDRFRGFSLSNGHPVADFDLSYDFSNGLYAAASGTLLASSNGGVQPLGIQIAGGYAKQLNSGLTIDAGIVHARYSHYSGLRYRRSYTEIYAGIAGKLLSSRLYFSPQYLGHDSTTYAELDGHLPAGQDFTIEGHAGWLLPLHFYRGSHRPASRYDWQIGISRPAGRFVLRAAFSAGGPRQSYYGDYSSGHALTFGITAAL